MKKLDKALLKNNKIKFLFFHFIWHGAVGFIVFSIYKIWPVNVLPQSVIIITMFVICTWAFSTNTFGLLTDLLKKEISTDQRKRTYILAKNIELTLMLVIVVIWLINAYINIKYNFLSIILFFLYISYVITLIYVLINNKFDDNFNDYT